MDKKIRSIDSLASGRTRVAVIDEDTPEVDLLIGADGGWSTVRKYILQHNNPKTQEQRWKPTFVGVSGIYGISACSSISGNNEAAKEGHLVLRDCGNIGALPLEDGKLAWTIHYPVNLTPERTALIKDHAGAKNNVYESKLVPGVYDASSTAKILHSHDNIYHPILGSFKPMFEVSERTIRSPLRLSVLEQNEIQSGNVAVIGDAARVLPPYAGQGELITMSNKKQHDPG